MSARAADCVSVVGAYESYVGDESYEGDESYGVYATAAGKRSSST
ncbi:hypothetical protein [Streptomyces sp. MUSC 14]|nr:hypothetical protein [Streptomyces sp. MUSC 14]